MSDKELKENMEELNDEELGEVSGGMAIGSLAGPVGVNQPRVATPGVVQMPGVGPAVKPAVGSAATPKTVKK